MTELILIGGGGHCKSCIDVIEMSELSIKGILDTSDKIGQKVLGYEIIGTDNDIEKYAKKDYEFLITLGQIHSAETRKKIFERIKNAGGKLATVISPLAYVSKHAVIGEGTIVMHSAIVNAGVNIGKNCIINTKSLIEHDCTIDDNCHIAVGAVLAGGVTVGEDSFIGANATIVQSIHLPPNSFIRANDLIKSDK